MKNTACGRPIPRASFLIGLMLTLGGCAGMQGGAPGVLIETAARGQPLAGAACVAVIGDLRWDVTTPAVIDVGGARGELRIVCNQTGYRTSELIFRPGPGASGFSASAGGGFGSSLGFGIGIPLGGAAPIYPKRLVIELNPP